MPNKNPYGKAVETIRSAVIEAYDDAVMQGLVPGGASANFDVSEPREKSHGDLATNFAMVSAKALKVNPRAVAQAIVDNLDKGDYIESAEIAGPGFINFRMTDKWYSDTLLAIEEGGADYGKTEGNVGKRIQVEFVSANPTGPMHLGNARGGVLGDVLSSIFQWTGYYCEREFYLNDTGNQVDLLGRSMEARLYELTGDVTSYPFPEDGYHGEDVKEHAKAYYAEFGDGIKGEDEETRRVVLRDYALAKNIAKMKEDLKRYRIEHDVWFSELSLYDEGGAVEIALKAMEENGALYEKDGAIWFAATKYGSEKDEVLRRGNGFYTYYMGDIAYHYNKLVTRAFDQVVDIWGADHHGHAVRFGSALEAISIEPSRLRFVLMQLVRLVSGGEVVRMSKRTGKAVTLSNLLDEIPVDAARFFFCSRQNDTQMEFDLDLAVKEDSDNPVYYVQYAHARICSILRNLEAEGIKKKAGAELDLSLLTEVEERDLIKLLSRFAQEIIMASDNLDPSRITKYLMEVAATFHKFYNACRVRVEDEALMQARLNLCAGAAQVLSNAMGILKVTCPDRM